MISKLWPLSRGQCHRASFWKRDVAQNASATLMLMLISCSRPRRELKMSSRSQHYGFQSATMVQSANGGHAYLFGNNASENDLSEEDGESYELRPRGRERLRRSTSKDRLEDIVYLSRDIQEGDTLNGIALQYHCPVSLFVYIVGAEQLRTGENMWCKVWSSRCTTAPPTLKENIPQTRIILTKRACSHQACMWSFPAFRELQSLRPSLYLWLRRCNLSWFVDICKMTQ